MMGSMQKPCEGVAEGDHAIRMKWEELLRTSNEVGARGASPLLMVTNNV